MVDSHVIAILCRDEQPMPAAEEGADAPRISLLDLEDLGPGDLDPEHLDAVLYPITSATDSLHAEVDSLRRLTDIPLISYSSDAGGREILHTSRRLGCLTHLQGPLSWPALSEAVRREQCLAEMRQALRRTREEARLQHEKLTRLIEIIKTANSVLEPARVMEVVLDKARDSLRCELWSLFLINESRNALVLERSGDGACASQGEFVIPAGHGLEWEVTRTRRPLIVNDVLSDPRHDDEFDRFTGVKSRSALVVPLVSRGRQIGVVRLVNRIPGQAFSPADQSLVTLLMEPAAIALENAILFKMMEKLSVTDDLTQLYNVRYLNGFLYREIKRSERYRLPVGVVFLDLDGFKDVNDKHGHLAGSQTLAEVGQVVKETVREIDMVSRYGGDEFVVILPQTGLEGAAVIAERIRRRIEQNTFLQGMELRVRLTASLGVSAYPEHGQSRDELIHKADAAMYRVKDSGKNRVQTAW